MAHINEQFEMSKNCNILVIVYRKAQFHAVEYTVRCMKVRNMNVSPQSSMNIESKIQQWVLQRSGSVTENFMKDISQGFLYFLFYLPLEMSLGGRKLSFGQCSGKSILDFSWVICDRNLLNETYECNKLILICLMSSFICYNSLVILKNVFNWKQCLYSSTWKVWLMIKIVWAKKTFKSLTITHSNGHFFPQSNTWLKLIKGNTGK